MDWTKYLNNERLRKSTRNQDSRNDFESDFGRVIFSPALRRMHDKTQVFPLTTDDNIHSRLTHSMEVMAIGHSLGLALCQNEIFVNKTKVEEQKLQREIPVLLKNACLVHDIGNPPFGHFGETAIKDYFLTLFEENDFGLSKEQQEDFTHFDGNAQGFRILTKLQILDDEYGLNLTYGTLATFLKYPNAGEVVKGKLPHSKRGIFQSEIPYLEKITEGCGLKNGNSMFRHPLAFLMEAADSICYLVMDIEDGFNKGWFGYNFLKEKLKAIPGLEAQFYYLDTHFPGKDLEATRVVKLRIHLIDRLVKLAIENFVKNIDSIHTGDYEKELIFDDPCKVADELMDFCKKVILPKREILSLELTGHSVLTGLFNYYIDYIFTKKDPKFRKKAQGLISKSIIRAALIENGEKENIDIDLLNNYFKLRVIVDFITGMTDQFALNHYQKLSGQKII